MDDSQGPTLALIHRECVALFRCLSAICILSPVSPKAISRETRGSTRVPIKVEITVQGASGSLTCEGETIVVNLHGALISTATGLSEGMRNSIHVYLTDKRVSARVDYVDPVNPLHCGIELDQPRNIWGVPLPPADWEETAASDPVH